MLTSHRISLLAILLLLLPLSPLSCAGEKAATVAGDSPSQPPTKGAAQGAAQADAKASDGGLPSDPLDFPVAPLSGSESVALNIDVRSSDGNIIKLSSLIADPTLLVYVDSDTDGRQNKAGTRLLKRLVSQGHGAGFRTVVLFTWGTTLDEVDLWFKKRKINRVARAAVDHEGTFGSNTRWSPRSAALIDTSGTVEVMFGASEEWDARVGFDGGLTSDLLFRAWQHRYPGPDLSAETQQAGVDVVRAALRAQWAGESLPASVSALTTQAQLSDKVDYPVYVSLFRPGTTTRPRGESSAGTLGEAIARATHEAVGRLGPESENWMADVDNIRFSVDVAGQPAALPTLYMKSLWNLVEPGVDGLIVRRGSEEGVMLPAEPVTSGFLSPRVLGRTKKLEKMFRELCKRTGLGLNDWKKDGTELLRFRTTAFGVATGDGPAVPFFRGNVLFNQDATQADLLDSLHIGTQWLVNTVKEDGKFDYEYFPNKDEGSKDYNIVRHAGSIYGLFESYHMAKQEKVLAGEKDAILEASARAMSFVYDSFGKPNGDEIGDRICLLERNRKNRCQSGSAALSLITFLVRPDKKDVPKKFHARMYRPNDDAIITGLALTLVDMIDRKGKVFRTYKQAMTMDSVKKEPLYYPGEAMLALMHMYSKTDDKRWLEATEKIAANQVKNYKRNRFRVPDHWVMQALHYLWKATKNDQYADTAYAMATHYSSEQYPNIWSPFPDYLGSWRRGNDTPRTTRAGSRSEALRAVVHLAWAKGDDATIWEDSLVSASRHLIEQQFSDRNSYWLPNP
ncbi:MAG TPA: hypothetical protein DIU15_13950, partial [Deltaproteobacteria bacterium]|nr:hypothetical protein [Deltaproteobacteria bacterium]